MKRYRVKELKYPKETRYRIEVKVGRGAWEQVSSEDSLKEAKETIWQMKMWDKVEKEAKIVYEEE
jgi:hypothetical protein